MNLNELKQLHEKGLEYGKQGLFEDALIHLYRVFNSAEEYPQFRLQAALDLGILYRKLEKYTAAAEMLSMVDESGDASSSHRFTAILERAIIGYKQRDIDQAMTHLHQAEQVMQNDEFGRLIVFYLHTRAKVEAERENHKKALEIFKQTLLFVDLFRSEELRSTIFNNIGQCYLKLGKMKSAMRYLKASLAIAHERGRERLKAETCASLVLACLKDDDLPLAKEYATRALKISYERKYRDIIRDVCYQVGRYYKNSGRENIADVFFEKAASVDGRLTLDYLKLLDTDRMSSSDGLLKED